VPCNVPPPFAGHLGQPVMTNRNPTVSGDAKLTGGGGEWGVGGIENFRIWPLCYSACHS
jgi:hypothetical protein